MTDRFIVFVRATSSVKVHPHATLDSCSRCAFAIYVTPPGNDHEAEFAKICTVCLADEITTGRTFSAVSFSPPSSRAVNTTALLALVDRINQRTAAGTN